MKEIVKKVYERLSSVYCDSCRNYGDDETCEWCDRKSMNWGISESEAESIVKMVEEEKE